MLLIVYLRIDVFFSLENVKIGRRGKQEMSREEGNESTVSTCMKVSNKINH